MRTIFYLVVVLLGSGVLSALIYPAFAPKPHEEVGCVCPPPKVLVIHDGCDLPKEEWDYEGYETKVSKETHHGRKTKVLF